jgi:hypothetical protein
MDGTSRDTGAHAATRPDQHGATRPDQHGATRPDQHGRVIVVGNIWSTVVFSVSAVVAAVVFTPAMRAQAVAISLGLFATGVAAFLWGFWNAIQRSRTEEIAVTTLFFLAGSTAPDGVRRAMNLCLGAQVTVGLATSLARPTTDGDPGSSLAFGILVPMLGLGLNGLWAAFHGAFPARTMTADGSGTGQDRTHG